MTGIKSESLTLSPVPDLDPGGRAHADAGYNFRRLLTLMSSMASYTAPLLNVDRVMTRQIMDADTNAELAFSSVWCP